MFCHSDTRVFVASPPPHAGRCRSSSSAWPQTFAQLQHLQHFLRLRLRATAARRLLRRRMFSKSPRSSYQTARAAGSGEGTDPFLGSFSDAAEHKLSGNLGGKAAWEPVQTPRPPRGRERAWSPEQKGGAGSLRLASCVRRC